ncbi:MAG: type II secretion system protein [Deltaproteobacteria bacterium]
MKGFTLLEVLVATAVLAVAMVSLLGLHGRNLRLVADTQELTEAGLLASRLATTAKTGAFPSLGTTRGQTAIDDRAARFSWKRDVAPTGLPGLHQVRIEVARGPTGAGGDVLADLVFLLRSAAR